VEPIMQMSYLYLNLFDFCIFGLQAGKASAKQNELKKAAQGTHSLFKFFTPKPKS
jgi:hypothetical protein